VPEEYTKEIEFDPRPSVLITQIVLLLKAVHVESPVQ
jgi:hypothetical protein